MSLTGSSPNENFPTNEQKEELLNVIDEHSGMVSCASEALGLLAWLKEKHEAEEPESTKGINGKFEQLTIYKYEGIDEAGMLENMPVSVLPTIQLHLSDIKNKDAKTEDDKPGHARIMEERIKDEGDKESLILHIIIDKEKYEELQEVRKANEMEWNVEAIKKKAHLRLNALHEIAHIALKEGGRYFGIAELGNTEERLVREELAPQLLDRKAKRFKEFSEVEQQFLNSNGSYSDFFSE